MILILHLILFFLALFCTYNGMQYTIGDVIQPNCTTRCTCQEGGCFDCSPQRCLVDGPTCYASGDPHYGSFDSRRFDFQGDCEYTKPCNRDCFIITATNTLWPFNLTVSVTSAVRVFIPSKGSEIYLGDGIITINGIMQPNSGDGVVHRSNGLEILRIGGSTYALLTVTFPVAVQWDGSWQVRVTVSSSWQGQLCGLCGNYNNDASDDFMLPDGSVTTSANDFGDSWLYAQTSATCGVPPSPPPCPTSVMTAAQSRCNELMNEVFSVCNSVVDPETFIDGCILDYCLCSDERREDCYCNCLSSYAAACASSGIIISNWRNFLCRKFFVTF